MSNLFQQNAPCLLTIQQLCPAFGGMSVCVCMRVQRIIGWIGGVLCEYPLLQPRKQNIFLDYMLCPVLPIPPISIHSPVRNIHLVSPIPDILYPVPKNLCTLQSDSAVSTERLHRLLAYLRLLGSITNAIVLCNLMPCCLLGWDARLSACRHGCDAGQAISGS